MKLNVIEYYSSFYKDIYKEGGYLLRSPVIYSFLLNFAKDGGVNPVAPDRKLGQERINARFDEKMETNPFALNFYEDRLLENALERLMKGYDLEEKDAVSDGGYRLPHRFGLIAGNFIEYRLRKSGILPGFRQED